MPVFAKNKKAYFEYEILEEFEAGIVLVGPEVKSIRRSQVQMKGSYVALLQDGAYVVGMHISPYKFANHQEIEPTRKRKLLLNAKEIEKMESAEKTVGQTIIPLSIYSKQGLIKIKVAIVKGKKLHDKRQTIKEREQNRQIKRVLKRNY